MALNPDGSVIFASQGDRLSAAVVSGDTQLFSNGWESLSTFQSLPLSDMLRRVIHNGLKVITVPIELALPQNDRDLNAWNKRISLAVSPDKTVVLANNGDRLNLFGYDVSRGDVSLESKGSVCLPPFKGAWYSYLSSTDVVAFSADGQYFIVGNGSNKLVSIWETAPGTLLNRQVVDSFPVSEDAFSVTWNGVRAVAMKDGVLAVADRGGTLYQFKLEPGKDGFKLLEIAPPSSGAGHNYACLNTAFLPERKIEILCRG